MRDLFFELMNRSALPGRRASATLEASEAARVAANVSRLARPIAEFCDANPDHSLAAYMDHLDLVLLSGEDEAPARPSVDAATRSR